MFELKCLLYLLSFNGLIKRSRQIPQFMDISNNCTIPTIPYGLDSIKGTSYIHWWTGDPTIKCATFSIKPLHRDEKTAAYNLKFSYYTKNNSHQSNTWLIIENPTRQSESESFTYDKNGAYILETINDMLHYEPRDGFILLKCPATSGGVPMTISIVLLTREENVTTVDKFKDQITNHGLDADELRHIYQGPECLDDFVDTKLN